MYTILSILWIDILYAHLKCRISETTSETHRKMSVFRWESINSTSGHFFPFDARKIFDLWKWRTCFIQWGRTTTAAITANGRRPLSRHLFSRRNNFRAQFPDRREKRPGIGKNIIISTRDGYSVVAIPRTKIFTFLFFFVRILLCIWFSTYLYFISVLYIFTNAIFEIFSTCNGALETFSNIKFFWLNLWKIWNFLRFKAILQYDGQQTLVAIHVRFDSYVCKYVLYGVV